MDGHGVIRLGQRMFNLRYLIWLERDEGDGVEAAFEVGRVFRFEGADAQALWKKASECTDPKPLVTTVTYGMPAVTTTAKR